MHKIVAPYGQKNFQKKRKKYKTSSQFSFLKKKYETSTQYFYARIAMG